MKTISQEEITVLGDRATELFKQGFNCSQAVFAACAPTLYGMDENLALRVAASFGGGIGRMRGVCGVASGMFLLAGMENGSATPGDSDGKMRNYALVQRLATAYKQEYGSLFCSELLGLTPKPGELTMTPRHEVAADFHSPQPGERTDEYFKKRPCVEMIREAVAMYVKTVKENNL